MPLVQADAPSYSIEILQPAPGDLIPFSSRPEMPDISVRVRIKDAAMDPPASRQFHYTIEIVYHNEHCHKEPDRPFGTKSELETDKVGATLQMPALVGGELSVTVEATVDGTVLQPAAVNGIRVVGTNPTRQEARSAFPNLISAKIGKFESGMRQFRTDSGASALCPLWSEDGRGGVGIMQITSPIPTDEDVWNWRTNIIDGVAIFQDKLNAAGNYPRSVARTPEFRNLVYAFNAKRLANGLPAITVTVPPFRSGDLDNNPDQVQLDGIRGFNGWAGRDQFNLHLHEFRLKTNYDGLVVHVNESDRTGSAEWEQVPVTDRPTAQGDPNYVQHILGSAP